MPGPLGSPKSKMTIFEYLSVAISIVFSLAIVRLLNGLPHLTASPKRYWVHAAWVIGLANVTAVMWWNLWAFRQIEEWVYPEFALLLLQPVTVYYLAATLIPDAPASVESWRSFFFQVRQRLYFATIFLFICMVLSSVVLLQRPVLHPLRVIEGAAVVLLLVGAFSENPRVHGLLVSFLVCGLAAAIALFFLRPGGVATS